MLLTYYLSPKNLLVLDFLPLEFFVDMSKTPGYRVLWTVLSACCYINFFASTSIDFSSDIPFEKSQFLHHDYSYFRIDYYYFWCGHRKKVKFFRISFFWRKSGILDLSTCKIGTCYGYSVNTVTAKREQETWI